MSNHQPSNFDNVVWENDRRHFVHPWVHFDSFRDDGSLIVSKAEGVYTYDAAGKRYLDGLGGLWCMNVGYGRDEIVDAIAAQARQLAYANPFTDVSNAPAAMLTAKLAELAPGNLNRVMLSCGGSTANDSILRLIHYYWGCQGKKSRQKIITRRGSYHG